MKYAFWIISTVVLIGGGLVLSTAFLQRPAATPLRALSPSLMPVSSSTPPGAASPVPAPPGSTVTLDGELVCLPRRSGGRELTLECALGLRTTEGQHYALENINPYLTEGKVAMGQQVKVRGLLRSDTATAYATVGIIYVTAVSLR